MQSTDLPHSHMKQMHFSLYIYIYIEPQGAGSSGKDIGLCGSPIRSKVQIPLGANNSLRPVTWRSRSIIRSVWKRWFTRIRGLPDRVGTQSPLGCKQFLEASHPAKPKYYPIRVEAVVYTDPRFT
jgi:hypothetical protein